LKTIIIALALLFTTSAAYAEDDCADTGGGDGALCICKTTNTWALIANY